MKALCIGRGGKFEGLIQSVEQYNRLKNGEIDWKPHVKNNLESVTIPYELFSYFMELDKFCLQTCKKNGKGLNSGDLKND